MDFLEPCMASQIKYSILEDISGEGELKSDMNSLVVAVLSVFLGEAVSISPVV